MKNKNYKEFVEKFKPKKTTDDCYTPAPVYNIVKNWAVKEYRLEGANIVRPFYPGGDFEHYDYPTNCAVIDNPPFSILAKIIDFYLRENIKFFLFAPHLTLFSNNAKISLIVTGVQIVYQNGVRVPTSFITNMDKFKIRSANELRDSIINLYNRGKGKRIKYNYPPNVITPTLLSKIVSAGKEFYIKENEVYFLRSLDSQRPHKKNIFGAGYLLSNPKSKELLYQN